MTVQKTVDILRINSYALKFVKLFLKHPVFIYVPSVARRIKVPLNLVANEKKLCNVDFGGGTISNSWYEACKNDKSFYVGNKFLVSDRRDTFSTEAYMLLMQFSSGFNVHALSKFVLWISVLKNILQSWIILVITIDVVIYLLSCLSSLFVIR
jgi:hypothetical protein